MSFLIVQLMCFTTAATRDSSNLLAHEAAFALGQMQDAEAIPALIAVLNDFSLHPIVRHEVGLYYVQVYVHFSDSHDMLIRVYCKLSRQRKLLVQLVWRVMFLF